MAMQRRAHTAYCMAPLHRHSSTAASAPRALPLTGVRVLDLSRVLAGPWCTMLLADQGADVMKIEPPAGDETRRWGPPFVNGHSTYFMSCNRGKRSVLLDLKSPAGRRAALALAASADVLVENSLPGAMERLGLDYASVRNANPRIVYASISGYGAVGPLAATPGYDVAVAAATGLLSITGEPSGAPCKPGVALTDIATGQYLHGAILGALFARERGGGGARLSTSLLECGLANLANVASASLIGHSASARWGSAHASIVPYQVFHDAHGAAFVVAAMNDRQFGALAAAIGSPGLAADARYATNAARVRHRESLVAALGDALRTASREHWVAVLTAAGVPTASVLGVGEAFATPQVAALGLVQHVDYPALQAGPQPFVANPVSSASDDDALAYLPISRPPPMLGQHTSEVLREVLAWSAQEVDEARKGGAFGPAAGAAGPPH